MVTVNLMWVYLWFVFQVQACIREAERIEYLVQTDSPLLKAYTTLTPFLLAPMRAPSTLPASDGQSYPPSLPLLLVLICLTLYTRRTMTLSWQKELFMKRRAFCLKTSQTWISITRGFCECWQIVYERTSSCKLWVGWPLTLSNLPLTLGSWSLQREWSYFL